jgi:D-tyrosyl-tRNA(Tyr) deacylase
VDTDGVVLSTIGIGLVALLGVAPGDEDADAAWMARKLVSLRIFEDEAAKMNLSLRDADGEILLVSNFTVCADASKGNRPSFTAANYEDGLRLFNRCAEELAGLGVKPRLGKYGASMRVALENDGPVTLILDSRKP